ncbi:hypothetical protein N7448_002096 [Penicillium atrosanguineum]|nr:hypothetical protein N7448_002096 [Penicillium atrosanguineum]
MQDNPARKEVKICVVGVPAVKQDRRGHGGERPGPRIPFSLRCALSDDSKTGNSAHGLDKLGLQAPEFRSDPLFTCAYDSFNGASSQNKTTLNINDVMHFGEIEDVDLHPCPSGPGVTIIWSVQGDLCSIMIARVLSHKKVSLPTLHAQFSTLSVDEQLKFLSWLFEAALSRRAHMTHLHQDASPIMSRRGTYVQQTKHERRKGAAKSQYST